MPIITIVAYRASCKNWHFETLSDSDLGVCSFDDAEKAADWLSQFYLSNAFEGTTIDYNDYEFDFIIDGVNQYCSKHLNIAESTVADKDPSVNDEHEKLVAWIETRAGELVKPKIAAELKVAEDRFRAVAARRNPEETADARREYNELRARVENR